MMTNHQDSPKAALTALIFAIFGLVGVFAMAQPAQAALPAGFETETIATGMNLPTGLAFTPDGRIFVTEKAGAVRLIKNGALVAEPVIQLTDVNTYADRGLSGIAVDPNFSVNHYIYLSYTYENTPGSNFTGTKTGRIIRLTVEGDTASESSKLVLVGTEGGDVNAPSCENFAVTVDCIPSDSSSHSVGALRFGPDGRLYATLGDGANFDVIDPRALRAQNIDSLGGKMLRINTDGTGPTDNPFYNGNPNSNRSKVYAYGFRNMYRFNFRQSTGAVYGGDVGWDTWEELNRITPGGNFGWPCREGNNPTTYNCPATGYVNPLYTYIHDPQIGGAITAGVFPGASAYPAAYANRMFFADYAFNWMKTMELDAAGNFIGVSDFMLPTDGADGPVEFAVGPEGRVYFISIYTGSVRRINYTLGNRQPVAQIAANPTSGLSPLAVNFSSAGSMDPDNNPLTYFWNFANGSSSVLANPQHTYNANGTYLATLNVTDGQGGSSIKNVTINVGNRAPVPDILTPYSGEVYFPGEVIGITGQAIDPEQGSLPGSSLTWRVILHHNVHTHLLETRTGTSFQWTAPDHGDPDVYTEIQLTATDAGGVSATTSINLYLNNNVSPDGNMVRNNSVETADPVNAAKPDLWNSYKWGTSTAVFSYPVAGQSGSRAVRVTVSGHASGDAKWGFDPARVKENKDIVFSDYYMATVPTRLVAEVGYINGTYTYEDLAVLPAAAVWTQANATFRTPAAARTLVIYHLLDANGTLTVDNFAMRLAAVTPPPPVGNLILNNSLETGTTTPANWQSNSWGTNTTAFTYPVTGQDGVKAARVAMTAYTSGDAKWIFDNVAVTPGTLYTFRDYYQSTVPTQLVIRYTSTAGAASYAGFVSVPASAASFQQVTTTFTPPAGTASVSVFHILSAVGNLTVDNFSLSTGTVPPPPPPAGNLITNGFMETANGANPQGWTPTSVGTLTPVYTYPTLGVDGNSAAAIQVTGMPAGADANARWQHAEVPISTGIQYTYNGFYKGSTITDIIGRYTFNDGSQHFFGLKKEIPAAVNWTAVTGVLVGPVNVQSITLMHQLSTNGTMSIDNASLVATGTGTPNEIIPPVVNFTNPLNGQTVSGTVSLTANATDNTGVVNLFYAVDGTPLSANVPAPYTMAWDSSGVANGSHALKVTATDAFGNNSREIITVTVNNTGTPPPPPPVTNLILNPSLETGTTTPVNWQSNRWGTNTTAFTYPVTGQDGAKAARVAVTAYTSGDAKWIFDNVAVTPGTQYAFRDYYQSTAATQLVIRYTSTTGAVTYTGPTSVPASPAAFQQATMSFTPPAGTASASVFHVLSAVGTLTVDNYSLSTGTPPPPIPTSTFSGTPLAVTAGNSATLTWTTSGAASVTLTPGFGTVAANGSQVVTPATTTTYTLAATNANGTATKTVTITVNPVTPPPPAGNLVLNPSLEAGTTAPTSWAQDFWGTNTRTFTYPVTGNDGAKAARVAITAYTSGDAKWAFDHVAVTPGRSYTFSDYYQSSITSTVVVEYLLANGTYQYVVLGTAPVSAAWRTHQFTFTAPATAASMTVYHLISAVGNLTIDQASVIAN